MKVSLFLIALGLSSSLCLCLTAQTSISSIQKVKTNADYYWDTKPDLRCATVDQDGNIGYSDMPVHLSGIKFAENNLASFKQFNTLKYYAAHKEKEKPHAIFSEIHRRYFREWGIQFWQNFPDDERRFDWLLETVNAPPIYFLYDNDIVTASSINNDYDTVKINVVALQSWNNHIKNFKKEYLNSSRPVSEKEIFLIKELNGVVRHWRKKDMHDKFDYEGWVKLYMELDAWRKKTKKETEQDRERILLRRQLNQIVYGYRRLGMNKQDVAAFVSLLEKTGIPVMIEFVKEFRQPRQLELYARQPMEFKGKTLAGNPLEMKDLKGKLVFVDLWSIGCGSCIESMPKLHRLYDKYKQYGFEIVSACFVEGKRDNGTIWFPNELERIEYVHKELSGDWPLILLERAPGEKVHRIRSLYEMTNMNPNYMLFDENGEILKINGELQYSLEAIIREHFIRQGKIKQ